MTARSQLPVPDDAFRVSDGLRAGASPSRLRAGDLLRWHHGGRARGSDALRALVPLMRADQGFAGPTAARLHGLPLPRRHERDPRLHVVALSGDRMRRPGVVGSRASAGRILALDGIPVLDPVSTWASLAGILAVDDLVAVADRLLTGDLRTPAPATSDDLRRVVGAASGRRHVRDLREALTWARVGAWSRPETLLRLHVVRSGLPEPVLNAGVRLRSGETVRPDLAWPDVRIAVEYDGSAFHGRDRWDADAARHERLVDDGWLVVRVRAADLFDAPRQLTERLRRRFGERARSVGVAG